MPEVVTTIPLASTMVKGVEGFSRDVLLSRVCRATLCSAKHLSPYLLFAFAMVSYV
jgi:hypothetical protein